MTVTAPPIINITIQIMYLCPAVAMVRDPFGSPADCCTITSWPSLSHDCFCQTFIISRSYSIKITDKGRIVISWLCSSSQVTPPVHPEILPFLVQDPTTLEKALQVLGISYIFNCFLVFHLLQNQFPILYFHIVQVVGDG